MLLGSSPARVLLASNGEIRLLTINGTDLDPVYHIPATSVKGLDYNHRNNSFCYVSHFSTTTFDNSHLNYYQFCYNVKIKWRALAHR